MSISRVTSTPMGPAPVDSVPGEAPAGADVAWFNAALQPQEAKPSSADRLAEPVSRASASLQQFSDTAMRDLQRAAKSIDPQEVLQANRSLSSFYLESLLSAKLVSKAAQSIEKLTSLQ